MSIQSLVAAGTKVWLDSIDPEMVRKFARLGVTGATSNPIIIADIVKAGGLDGKIRWQIDQGLDDAAVAWQLTDQLVRDAQEVFRPAWEQSGGDDGYVSFELDPLLEDPDADIPVAERTRRYIDLGRRWARGHDNRMIKVPATEAGLAALEELAAAGVTLNVTLCFTERQYRAARDAVWHGARRRKDGLENFKSVYSIFVSRVDVYAEKRVPELSPEARGLVGIVNAKVLWRLNQEFWRDKGLRLKQEIIFASTGTKNPADPPDKYVQALAGSDIQTNPPKTLDAVEKSRKTYNRTVDQLPPPTVVDEILNKVDPAAMEAALMAEGIEKFTTPQKELEKLIAQKRTAMAAGRSG